MIIFFPFKMGSLMVYKSEFYKPGTWIVSIWYGGGKNLEYTFGKEAL